MNGLSCGEEGMTIMFSRFDTIAACDGRTVGQTNGRTDVQPIAITCVSLLTHVKNRKSLVYQVQIQLCITVNKI